MRGLALAIQVWDEKWSHRCVRLLVARTVPHVPPFGEPSNFCMEPGNVWPHSWSVTFARKKKGVTATIERAERTHRAAHAATKRAITDLHATPTAATSDCSRSLRGDFARASFREFKQTTFPQAYAKGGRADTLNRKVPVWSLRSREESDPQAATAPWRLFTAWGTSSL